MKQRISKSDKGLNMDYPRVISSENSFLMQFFFYIILLIIGLTGAYGCFYSAFSVPISLPIFIALGIIFLSAFSILFLSNFKYTSLVVLIPLFLMLIGAFIFKNSLITSFIDQIVNGFILTFNIVSSAYAQKIQSNFIILPIDVVNVDEVIYCCTIFAVCTLYLTTFLMSWLLIIRKNAILNFWLTMPFLAVSLIYSIIPSYWAVACLSIFWSFLLINPSSYSRNITKLNRRESTFYSQENSGSIPQSLILIPILAICLIILMFIFPKDNLYRLSFIDDLRGSFINSTNLLGSHQSTITGDGNTNIVNLELAGNLSFTGKIVLRIKSSNHNTEYLKGFVGSVYTGNSWEDLSREDYKKLNAILKENKVQTFPSTFIQLLGSSIDKDAYQYNMTVRNVRNNSKRIYSPYGLISGSKKLKGIDFVNDGYMISSNTLLGTKEYSMDGLKLDMSNESLSLYERLSSYFSNDQNDNYNGPDLNKELTKDFDSSIQKMDEWRISVPVVSAMTPEQTSFTQTVYEYSSFVYAHYTQLPQTLKERLDKYRDQYDLDTRHYPRPSDLAKAIVDQIQKENNYSLSPGLTPKGSDFVEYFLFENHRGYCMHFASSAAALLRSAGIPARYVEGYVIYPSDFSNQDEWANIPDSRSHAWVEIYYSGLGWIPIEATPPSANGTVENGHETAESATPPTDESTEEEATEEQPDTTEPTDDPNPDEESSNNIKDPGQSSSEEKPLEVENSEQNNTQYRSEYISPILITLLKILSVLALMGLIIVLFIVIRKIRIRLRYKGFIEKDNNESAIAIYEYILKLLKFNNIDKSPVKNIPDHISQLVLKARFSHHTLTDEETEELKEYAEKLMLEIKNNASLFKRLVGKYIYSLF